MSDENDCETPLLKIQRWWKKQLEKNGMYCRNCNIEVKEFDSAICHKCWLVKYEERHRWAYD